MHRRFKPYTYTHLDRPQRPRPHRRGRRLLQHLQLQLLPPQPRPKPLRLLLVRPRAHRQIPHVRRPPRRLLLLLAVVAVRPRHAHPRRGAEARCGFGPLSPPGGRLGLLLLNAPLDGRQADADGAGVVEIGHLVCVGMDGCMKG